MKVSKVPLTGASKNAATASELPIHEPAVVQAGIPTHTLEALTAIQSTRCQDLRAQVLREEAFTGVAPFTSQSIFSPLGDIWRGARDYGEERILQALVAFAPATADRLAEELVEADERGVLYQIANLVVAPQLDRYEALYRAYVAAINNAPVLAEELARFHETERPEEQPDYSRHLVGGMLQPILKLGHGLPKIQNSRVLRTAGAVLDRLKEYEIPENIKCLELGGLEEKELDTIARILAYAAFAAQRNSEKENADEAKRLEAERLKEQQVIAPALPQRPQFQDLPNGFINLDPWGLTFDVNREERILMCKDQVILSAAVRKKFVMALTTEGLFTRSIPLGCYGSTLQVGPEVDGGLRGHMDIVQDSEALSPSGRLFIAKDRFFFMNEESRIEAQRTRDCLQLFSFGEEEGRCTYTSFEPTEGERGSARAEVVNESFRWGGPVQNEHVIFSARHIPRIYTLSLDSSGHRMVSRYDVVSREYDYEFRECGYQILDQVISPDGRFVAALVGGADSKFVTFFDRETYRPGENRDDAMHPVKMEFFWNAESLLQETTGLLFLPNNNLLCLNSAGIVNGIMTAKSGRCNSIEWREPKFTSFKYAFVKAQYSIDAERGIVAVVGDDEKVIDFYTLKDQKRVGTITPELETEERISFVRMIPEYQTLLIADTKGGVWEVQVG